MKDSSLDLDINKMMINEALMGLYAQSDDRGKETIIRVAESQSTPYSVSDEKENNHQTGT